MSNPYPAEKALEIMVEDWTRLHDELQLLKKVARKALDVSCLAEYGELFGLGVDGPYVVPRRQMLELGQALEDAGITP